MAINDIFESCDEIFKGRTGTPFDISGKRDYVRKFLVRVKTNLIGSLGVCYCPGIPQPFSPYNSGGGLEYDLAALCVRVTAEQETEEDWSQWIVTANYSTEMPPGGKFDYGNPGKDSGSGDNASNNPEFEAPDIDWDFDTDSKVVVKDLDSKPILNSSKQPFDPPLAFDQAYAVLTYTRNSLFFDRKIATDYAYAVNTDNFLGAPPGAAQCLPPRARWTHKGNIAYWRVTWRVRFAAPRQVTILGLPIIDLATWQPQILDTGTMQLVTVLGQKISVPIWRGGQPVPGPILLDGNGRPAPLNADGTITPHYLDYRIFQGMPFNPIFEIKPGEVPGGLA